MNTILLTAGVVAVLAAVIGGGLKAFNIEMPVLQSAGIRLALGLLGVAFLGSAYLLRDDAPAKDDPSIARYQHRVVATCNAVRRLNERIVATPQIDTPDLRDEPSQGLPQPAIRYDRDEVLAGTRANDLEVHRRLDTLIESPPKSLSGEVQELRDATDKYVAYMRGLRTDIRDALPARPTVQELQALLVGRRSQGDEAQGALEDSLTQLGDSDCSLGSERKS